MGRGVRRMAAMLASGVLFTVVGVPLGLVIFLIGMVAIGGVEDALVVSPWLSIDGWLFCLGVAAVVGTVPAFVTGLIAAVVRPRFATRASFAGAMLPIGGAATALYLLCFGSHFGWGFISPASLAGALSAVGCALLYDACCRAADRRLN